MCNVSVVIPIYNQEKCLKRAIESVIAQTYKRWELILIDDGSTDRSEEICNQYVEQFDTIRLYKKKNGGASSARNRGIEEAKGKYILFLDGDDYIEKETINSLVKRIEEEQSDVVLFAMQIDRFIGERIRSTYLNMEKDLELSPRELCSNFVELYRKDYLCSSCTKLFKRGIIENNNIRFCESLTMYEDFCFVLEYLEHSTKISIDKRIYYHYMMDETVITINKRNSKTLLENLDTVAHRIYDFIFKNRNVLTSEEYKIIFEIYIMYFYKLFVGDYSNREKICEIKRALNNDFFKQVTRKSIRRDEGIFFGVLRWSIVHKKAFIIYLIYKLKYWN